MSIKRVKKLLARKRWRKQAERRHAHRAMMPQAARPMIELMEPRLLLSAVIVVDSTLDVVDEFDGVTTLREAILLANNTPNVNGPDRIHFNIPGLDPGEAAVIDILTALPTITEAVIIDGTTQSGYDGAPLIELRGDTLTHISGLKLTDHAGSTIRGLSIHGFRKNGIEITSSLWHMNGHTIEDNYIGLDASGADGLGNGVNVSVYRSIGTIVRNNVISNAQMFGPGHGILLDSAFQTVIQGNLIGTDATGTDAIGNKKYGILLSNSSVYETIIGGSNAGEGNVISGNEWGIFVANESNNNVIQGNYIGTDITGTEAIGNIYGIGFGTRSHHKAGHHNLVGGAGEGEGNIISGNALEGIAIGGDDNTVQGNRIGVDANGAAMGNGTVGIRSSGNNNLIGGLDEGAGNIIAHNGEYGVHLTIGAGTSVFANSIYSNGTQQIDPARGVGIKIGGLHVPIENDPGDLDTGANNQQNHPHILAAAASAGSITIDGMLSSTVSTTFTIEFYASLASDPGRYDQGEIFLGRAEVTTDENGEVYFTETLAVAVPVGYVITATATAPDGSTSEFSRSDANATVVPGNAAPTNLVVSFDETTITENGSVLLSLTFDDDDAGDEHTVTIDWGDGTSDVVVLTNGERTLDIAHQYLDDSGAGSYTVDVTVTDSEDGSVVGATSVTVENAAPVASAITGPTTLYRGDTANFASSFTDAGTLDTHTTEWVITDSDDNVVASGSGLAIDYTPTTTGDYTVTFTVTDDDGDADTQAFNFTVENALPTNLVVSVDETTITENGSVLLSLTFDDDDAGDEHTVTIDWGDGTSDVVVLTNGERMLDIAHQYLDDSGTGSYTVDVTVTDSEDDSVIGATSVTVENAAPVVAAITGPTTLYRGDTANFASSFTDAGTLDTHTTAWVITDSDDNVVASGSGLAIDYTPTTTGDYTVTFTVTDDDGDSDTQALNFTVENALPANLVVSVDETTITENGSVLLSLTFDDDDAGDEHTVTIDWGDGTSDVVVLTNGERMLDIAHQYLDDSGTGSYTVDVTVTDSEDDSVVGATSVTVENAAPVVAAITGPTTLYRGDTANFASSFTDAGTLDTHTTAWVVTDSNDNVVASGSGLAIDYTPTTTGDYTVTFTVTDDDGDSDTQALNFTVENALPTNLVVSVDETTITENGSVLLSLTFDDDDAGDEHTVTIDWGDGTSDVVVLTNGERMLDIAHQYLDDSGAGSYTVDVTVTDSEDDSVIGATSVTVENAAPVASAITGPTEVEVNEMATFTASFTDAGTLDTHTTAWVITDADDNIVAGGSGLSIDFTPTTEGTYTVTFTVTDDDGDHDTQALVFSVTSVSTASDLQLSLDETLITENGSVNLTISFQDPDLDREHTVTIDWGDGNSDVVVLPIGDRIFNIAHQYLDDKGSVDDIFTINVTVADADGSLSTSTDLTVANAAPVISSVSGPADVLRGETATFTAAFTDAGSLDTHTTSWVIKDGDDNIVASGSDLSIDFNTMDLGTYTATFTVTDDSGDSDSQSVFFTVKSYAIRMDDVTGWNTLFIMGGDDADEITLTQNGSLFNLDLNGDLEVIVGPSIEHIVIYGNAGDDTIIVNNVLDMRTEIFGGDGDDYISAGGYQNIIVGGDGDDHLIGGRRDLMIGGFGADLLEGKAREDVLVSGATLWDDDRVALWGLMSEIVFSGHNYAGRVKHLRNGTGFTNGYALNSSTVIEDNAIDTLKGQGQRDYFIVGAGDIITDKGGEETVDRL